MKDGEDVLDRLCAHPGTARHIARKLCCRFVGENPSTTLVSAVADAFGNYLTAPDQITRMLRVVLASDEFKTRWGDGMKRPFDSIIAGLRAIDSDFVPMPDNTNAWTTSEQFFNGLQLTGNRPFHWGPPNGYPDTMRAWASSGALAMTMKTLTWLTDMREDNSNENSPLVTDVVAQTKAAIPAANRSAEAIVNYWSQRILGGPLQPASGVATTFLRQNADTDEPLDLDHDDWNTGNLKRHYTQSRLRSSVGLLLASPDFLRR